MTAIYDYRLAFSTISKATLLASSAYNIENFPIQADQTNPGLGWTEPIRDRTKRFIYDRVTVNADKSITGDGFFKFDWGFEFWTEDQMGYILDTAFGGANVYGSLSIPVTAQTFAETGYVCFHALLARPIWGTHYQTQDGGYDNILLNFTRAKIIS